MYRGLEPGGISIADPARLGGPSDRLELFPPLRPTTAAAATLPTHRLGVSPASWVPVMCEAVCAGGGREAVGERQDEAAEVIWSLDDEGPVE